MRCEAALQSTLSALLTTTAATASAAAADTAAAVTSCCTAVLSCHCIRHSTHHRAVTEARKSNQPSVCDIESCNIRMKLLRTQSHAAHDVPSVKVSPEADPVDVCVATIRIHLSSVRVLETLSLASISCSPQVSHSAKQLRMLAYL